MDSGNPYKSPLSQEPGLARAVMKALGTVILGAGLAILGYGAIAFWVIPVLPPNGGVSGRLPSLYVMGVGILVAVTGLVARDLRVGRKRHPSARSRSGIPTIYGILALVAIVIVLFVVLLRL